MIAKAIDMADTEAINRKVPKTKGDSGLDRMTKAKGKLHLGVPTKDGVETFRDMSKDSVFGNLSIILKVYDSICAPELKSNNRTVLPLHVVMVAWGNDTGRAEGRGEWKHVAPAEGTLQLNRVVCRHFQALLASAKSVRRARGQYLQPHLRPTHLLRRHRMAGVAPEGVGVAYSHSAVAGKSDVQPCVVERVSYSNPHPHPGAYYSHLTVHPFRH